MRTALLLIPLALAGCSATKKATREGSIRTEQQRQTQAVELSQTHRQESATESSLDRWSEQLNQAAEARTDERLRVEMTLYDTDKPADPLTGRPPVRAEVTLSRERQEQTCQSRQDDRSGSAAAQTRRESAKSDSLRSEWNAREQTGSETRWQERSKTVRRTPWWVYALLMSGLAALAHFLRRKFKGRF